MARMAADGPVGAVGFCQEQAPRIAAEVAQRHDVLIGRVGVRVRNPANAAQGWQGEALAAFERRVAAGESPRQLRYESVDPAAGTLRMAKGIGTEPACLICHGSEVSAPVREAIHARYPHDAATGFSEGELRGAFWVEAALAATARPDATAPATDTPAVPIDPRIAIPLSPTHAAELRTEMRGQLMNVQGLIAALAADDWKTVAELADAQAPGRHRHGGGPPGFRAHLPPTWFDLARPMHQGYAGIAEEARGERRKDVALERLSSTMVQCASCHAMHRIEERAAD